MVSLSLNPNAYDIESDDEGGKPKKGVQSTGPGNTSSSNTHISNLWQNLNRIKETTKPAGHP